MPRIDACAPSWVLGLVEVVRLQSCARTPIYAAFDLWKDSTLRRVGITFRLPPLEANPVHQMAFDVVAWCVPMPWTLPVLTPLLSLPILPSSVGQAIAANSSVRASLLKQFSLYSKYNNLWMCSEWITSALIEVPEDEPGQQPVTEAAGPRESPRGADGRPQSENRYILVMTLFEILKIRQGAAGPRSGGSTGISSRS